MDPLMKSYSWTSSLDMAGTFQAGLLIELTEL